MNSRALVLTLTLMSGISLVGDSTASWAQAEGEASPKDVRGLPVPAWQADAELLGQWQRFTGRYIFERACGDCHDWGPRHLDENGWREFLDDFPANHEPDVTQEYEDLTARFAPGRMVPGAEEQLDALTAFLVSQAAPSEDARSDEPWSGLPEVGSRAPDFRFTDLEGQVHTLADYVGSRRLVLVMSRAYW